MFRNAASGEKKHRFHQMRHKTVEYGRLCQVVQNIDLKIKRHSLACLAPDLYPSMPLSYFVFPFAFLSLFWQQNGNRFFL